MCLTTTTSVSSATPSGNLRDEGKTPGDGLDNLKPSGGIAGKCTGGPECSGKDYESCEKIHAEAGRMCQWATEVAAAAMTSKSTFSSNSAMAATKSAVVTSGDSHEEMVCMPSCQEQNFPGDTAALSMCERDSCKGCPMCLTTTTSVSSATPSGNLRDEGKTPGDGLDNLKPSGGIAGKCTGGPECSGKDYESCEKIHAEAGRMCQWATEGAAAAMTSKGKSSSKNALRGTESEPARSCSPLVSTLLAFAISILDMCLASSP